MEDSIPGLACHAQMALGFSVAMDFRLRRVISQALGFQPSTGFSAKHWVFSQALGFQPSTGFSAKHWVFAARSLTVAGGLQQRDILTIIGLSATVGVDATCKSSRTRSNALNCFLRWRILIA
jgi:hypothetical protein